MKITTLFTALLLAASSYAQNINMNLFAQRTYTQELSDIWGYVDTLGNEYAIVGVYNGVSIVDVTDSTNIQEVYFHPGVNSIWRDIKTNGKYAYVSTEGGGGVLIIDLSPLPGAITNTTTYTGNSYPFSDVHNLFVDENEVLYVFGADYGKGGAIMLDVSGANAMAPQELGVFDDYYFHDGMARGDTLWGGAIYKGWFAAVDVSNKSSTSVMGTKSTPHSFTHNAWVSDDGDYLYTTDEKNGAFVAAYDVSDLGNIQEVDRYQSSPGQNVIPHNTHVKGDFLVTSYYKDGVTVVDATYPYNLIEVGNFDTSPFSGGGFAGCWGTYPWLPSGKVLASDSEEGLFILNTTYQKACYLEGNVTDYSNSNPLSGVTVSILNTSVTATTDGIGFYATGLVDAGTYNIQFSKTGYITQTITNVSLQNGVLTTLDVELAPLAPFTLTGKVIEASNGNPIQNADIKFKNFDNEFTTTTDANGDFSIPSFLQGTYEVTGGKWLYINNCFPNEFVTSSYTITIPFRFWNI